MDNIFGWLILVIILAFALYSAFVIKKEKIVALKNAKPLHFGGLIFPIPPWWTQTFKQESNDESKEETKIIFERTDTRYDWRAVFYKYDPNHFQGTSLQNIFEEFVIKREINFDQSNAIIKTPSEILSFSKIDIDALRIEGTATEASEDRIYIDIIVFKNKDTDTETDKIYIIESRSSILNGLLEGPFFEQMIEQVKK